MWSVNHWHKSSTRAYVVFFDKYFIIAFGFCRAIALHRFSDITSSGRSNTNSCHSVCGHVRRLGGGLSQTVEQVRVESFHL